MKFSDKLNGKLNVVEYKLSDESNLPSDELLQKVRTLNISDKKAESWLLNDRSFSDDMKSKIIDYAVEIAGISRSAPVGGIINGLVISGVDKRAVSVIVALASIIAGSNKELRELSKNRIGPITI